MQRLSKKLVDEEFNKGYQSKPFTASQMNAKCGVGRLATHAVVHPRGGLKEAKVDCEWQKGRGHNAATSEKETMYVISTTFAADACGVTCRAILMKFVGIYEETIRQCFQAPEHQGAIVIAHFSERSKSWMFLEVFGMVQGMRSSVVHFSRFQTLCSSMARRV